ncbi:von Willebrand factor [Chryseobacterium sp. StRB126]|uniref:T9SS type A sorting domain-containing protein n=1 Tax=Chryseobacterium sp. StRB126 TaxID=878220 RepID=UPI0004E98464|nr:T9SS type A sorting domain-containing protein [Chryseobacterium sp. StRB126]BAP33612.1 von Willebrand factor [Chryseobacterium sp. StRB126]
MNGTTLTATGNTLTLSPSQLNAGSNTLLFSVVDNNPLLKVDNHSSIHITNVSWTLIKSTLGLSEVNAEERRFSIYPNPTTGEFYVKGKNDFSKNVNVEIYDASGKHIPNKFELSEPASIKIDIKNFPTGTYLMNIIENKNIIISQKIIKE